MCICPRCGSFIDAGEPYCPDCGYMGSDEVNQYEDTIKIDGEEYSKDEVEEILRGYGYDLRDLEDDLIDEEDLEDIMEALT